MTRWGAQGIAVAGWALATALVSCLLPRSSSLLLEPDSWLLRVVFVCGPFAAGAAALTTLLVLAWRAMTPRAVAWANGAVGFVCLVALGVSLGYC
jgi:uncharacterized membrane protein